MSTLSSASTLQQVEASYADNASYAEDNFVAQCRTFITACRPLVLKYPKRTGPPQAELTTARDLVQAEKKAAEKWLEANDTGAGSTAGGARVTRVSFENSR